MCVGPEIMMAMQIGGAALSASGAFGQFGASKRQSEASKEAAYAEMQGQRLMFERQKREVIRAAQNASAVGLVNVTNQTGSSARGSSALPGAQAQITGQANEQTSNLNQQWDVKQKIFAANIKSIEAGEDAAFWKGISGVGGAVMGAAKPGSEFLDSFFNGRTTRHGSTGVGPWDTTTSFADDFPYGGTF